MIVTHNWTIRLRSIPFLCYYFIGCSVHTDAFQVSSLYCRAHPIDIHRLWDIWLLIGWFSYTISWCTEICWEFVHVKSSGLLAA